VLHPTPTSSSWLNLVERWFGELTTKKLRSGGQRSAIDSRILTLVGSHERSWVLDPGAYVAVEVAHAGKV
jgi:hypothetical protein